jgi:hypothetical protein
MDDGGEIVRVRLDVAGVGVTTAACNAASVGGVKDVTKLE